MRKKGGCKIRAAGNQKVFRCSSFSKMLPRCGRAAHICEANRNCTMKIKQKSKRESKESQLPFKIKRIQLRNKVSGAIAIPKASWGCAPALPNRIRVVFLRALFPVMSRRQRKSFLVQQFFKNAAEVWASSPHLRSKFDFAICFPCCNCIF